jgi:HEAT repeat protein
MTDVSLDVRSAAVVLLGQTENPSGPAILADALERDRVAASRVATALDASPVDAPELVLRLLHAGDARIRYWAALLVCRYPSIPHLSRTLGILTRDPDPPVRKAAIETIGTLGFVECTLQLRERLTDPVAFVRAHAARALGALGETGTAPAVATLLADRDWLVRSAARQGLEAMGPEIVPVLLRMLTHRDPFARNSAAEVLQNLGVLDELVGKYTRGREKPPDGMLEQLARAGGPRIWESVLRRLDAATRSRLRERLPSPLFEELAAETR